MSFQVDSDSDTQNDDSILDTSWIQDVENEILYDEYCNFIIDDITSIHITFLYINKKKEIIDSIQFIAKLKIPNQISQNEILNIMQKHQTRVISTHNKKQFLYYNFYSMIHYSFYLNDDPKSVASYLLCDDNDNDENDDGDDDDNCVNYADSSCIKEYTNIISIHTLYFKPLLNIFKDITSLTIILNED